MIMIDKPAGKQNNDKTILTVVLLIAFPIAGVPMMWICMKWHIRPQSVDYYFG